MKRIPAKLIAIVTLISTAVSSMAAENRTADTPLQLPAIRVMLNAPQVLSKKTVFDSTELLKYQALAVQSQEVAAFKSAGASDNTKTVLMVVGIAVVAVGVVALFATHGGKSAYLGSPFAQ